MKRKAGTKMRYVKISVMAAVAASLVFVSACSDKSSGGSSEASSGNGSNSGSGGQTNSGKPGDPFGKYDQTVTIKIGQAVDPTDKSLPAGDTPANNQYTRYVKDNLNIDTQVAWQAATGTNYDQKVNLSIASNDLPDAMVVNDAQLRQMAKAGELQDLSDAYNNYASEPLKKIIDSTNGVAMKSVTFDGKMLALPNVTVQADGIHEMWIRKDWLDKLHLQPPKTMDDLEKVAKAFVEQDPDGDGKADTIGIVGPQSGGHMYATFLLSTNNLYGFDPIFAAYDSYPGFWLKGDDGKPVYGSIQPQTKEALAKLRDLYAKGLIDQQTGVRKDSSEPIISGQAGIFFGPWWMGYGPLGNAVKNDPKANWQAYALPLDGNGQFSPHVGTPSSQFLVVRKGYEHPEAAIKMENLLLRDESKFDVSVAIGNYPLRIVYAPNDETEFTVKALREVLAGTKKPEDFANNPEYKLLNNDVNTVKKVKLQPYDKMDIQYWKPTADWGVWNRMYSLLVGDAPIVDQPMNKVPSLIYSQTKTMESRWANLQKMEDETFLKIILGAAPLDDFDKFVKDWKAQGGERITDEVAEEAKQ
ncbi:extracellular solute-binding protein [Paenibacillus humicola]|uniref:extracellular solute-binding protein n=1 Tax=Paenibacillus humicola TaxID=3110540 RepID=UPI003B82CFFB